MFLPFIRICSLILLLFFITGAKGEKPVDYENRLIPLQYPDEAHATKNSVFVKVNWMEPAEVNKYCNGGIVSDEYVILGCYDPKTNSIYVPQPRNFNDTDRLEILGHEFWHALGAEHP